MLSRSLLSLVLLLGACRSLPRIPTTPGAPSQLRYAENPAIYMLGLAITPNLPAVSGSVDSFTVSPPLPAGLVLDAATGELRGTPTRVSTTTEHIVTAANNAGLTSTTLTLTVADSAPAMLAYTTNPALYVVGQPIVANDATTTTGMPTRFSVAPPLPPGLALDPELGRISGTPFIAAPQTSYVVTAANDFGETTAMLALRVIEPPPEITYARTSFVFVAGEGSSTGAPFNAGGPIDLCALALESPPLPDGLEVHPATCEIFGFAGAPMDENVYSLSITHAGGTTLGTVTLRVNGPLAFATPTATFTASRGDSHRFSPVGGAPPYHLDIVSGSGVLAGEVFSVPDQPGVTTLRVQDSQGRVAFATAQTQRVLTEGTVRAWARGDDGGIFVGGAFESVHPYRTRRFAALDSNGAIDLGFDLQSGFDGAVNAIASDGESLYVGGSFTQYRGQPARRLAKIDLVTGALDVRFTRVIGFNNVVHAIALHEGRLYAGGEFNGYRGVEANSLIALDGVTGDPIGTFQHPLTADANVRALAAASDGLYVGGAFTAGATNLAKVHLDTGALLAPFNVGGPSSTVFAIALGPDALYIGGGFSQYRSDPADHLAKVRLSDASLDTTFTRPDDHSAGSVVTLLLDGDALYSGGNILKYDDIAVKHLVKVDAVTSVLDTSFSQDPSFNAPVLGLAKLGARLVVVGEFDAYRNLPIPRGLALLEADGTLVNGFGSGRGCSFDSLGSVNAVAVSGTRVLIGGAFSYYGGIPVRNIAKLAGESWRLDTTFTSEQGFDGAVFALAAEGGALFAGGNFTNYTSHVASVLSAQRLARIDAVSGALDTTFTQATGADGNVLALALSADHVFVGGTFTHYRGADAPRFAPIHRTTGAVAYPDAVGFGGPVRALLYKAPNLFVGGGFTSYRGVAVQRLVKINASTGDVVPAFIDANQGFTGPAGTVSALAFAPNGASALLVGGDFTSYAYGPAGGPVQNTLAVKNLIAIDDGSGVPSWNADGHDTDGSVLSLAVLDTPNDYDDRVFVGGEFTSYMGNDVTAPVAGLVILDHNLTPRPDLNPVPGLFSGEPSTLVHALFVTPASVLVGGVFSTYRGNTACNGMAIDASAGDQVY